MGPLGVLTIQRTLARGRLAGFLTGLGVATADGVYASFAAFGFAALSNFLISIQSPVRLIGGAFLLYLGIKTLLSKPAAQAAAVGAQSIVPAGSRWSDYLSALALTITNPVTILAFAAIFAGSGIAGTTGMSACAPFVVAGVFGGSILWWLVLTTGVSALRSRFTPALMVWINRLSGAIIITFALVALVGLLA